MIASVLGLVLCVSFWGLLHYLRKDTLARGKVEEKAKAIKEMLDDVQKAKSARAAIAADPALKRKLRDRNKPKQ